jgi:hypothetical protein
MIGNVLYLLQVLLLLVAFAFAVMGEPHWGGRYGPRPGYGWYRYPPGRNFGRTDDPRVIVILEDRRTSTAPPIVAPATVAPATVAPVTAG